MGVFLTLLVFVFPAIFIVGVMLGDAVGVGIFLGIALLVVFLIFCSGIGLTSGVLTDSAFKNTQSINNQEKDYLKNINSAASSKYSFDGWFFLFDYVEEKLIIENNSQKRMVWKIPFLQVKNVMVYYNSKLLEYIKKNDCPKFEFKKDDKNSIVLLFGNQNNIVIVNINDKSVNNIRELLIELNNIITINV